MTKATSSKAKGGKSGSSYRKPWTASRRSKPPFDAHASKARGLLKSKFRTLENRLAKVEFELFGMTGRSEEE